MKKMITAIIILIIVLPSLSNAFSVPEDCDADSWVLTKMSSGYATVYFYKDGIYQCFYMLRDSDGNPQSYSSLTIGASGSCNSGESTESDNMAVALYVIVGIALAFAFIKGIDVMNA